MPDASNPDRNLVTEPHAHIHEWRLRSDECTLVDSYFLCAYRCDECHAIAILPIPVPFRPGPHFEGMVQITPGLFGDPS